MLPYFSLFFIAVVILLFHSRCYVNTTIFENGFREKFVGRGPYTLSNHILYLLQGECIGREGIYGGRGFREGGV
jgi:protein-S-isoprenylcysteine O-methyltransferase Ste14